MCNDETVTGEVLPCHGFHDLEIPGRLEVEDGADIMVRRLEPVRIVVEVMEEEVEEGQEGQEREEGEEFPEMPGQLEVKAAEKKLKRRGRPRGSCYRPPDPSSPLGKRRAVVQVVPSLAALPRPHPASPCTALPLS